MPVTPAYFLSLSLSYLKEMIADSEVWRALVAQPDTDWDSLQTLIDAKTSPEAAAKAKIIEGWLEDDSGHADFVSRPRIALRHLDENDAERVSSTGYDLNGSLIVTFEIPVPAVHKADGGLASFKDAYVDAMNKVGGVITDLSKLTPQAGYLDLTNLGMGPTGLMDPKETKGELFFVSEWLIQFIGGP